MIIKTEIRRNDFRWITLLEAEKQNLCITYIDSHGDSYLLCENEAIARFLIAQIMKNICT